LLGEGHSEASQYPLTRVWTEARALIEKILKLPLPESHRLIIAELLLLSFDMRASLLNGAITDQAVAVCPLRILFERAEEPSILGIDSVEPSLKRVFLLARNRGVQRLKLAGKLLLHLSDLPRRRFGRTQFTLALSFSPVCGRIAAAGGSPGFLRVERRSCQA